MLLMCANIPMRLVLTRKTNELCHQTCVFANVCVNTLQLKERRRLAEEVMSSASYLLACTKVRGLAWFCVFEVMLTHASFGCSSDKKKKNSYTFPYFDTAVHTELNNVGVCCFSNAMKSLKSPQKSPIFIWFLVCSLV